MVEQLDIWKAANLLVEWHGCRAPVIAAQRAQAMLNRGDVAGYLDWRRLLEAVDELTRAERWDGERMN